MGWSRVEVEQWLAERMAARGKRSMTTQHDTPDAS
jgi:hypothetical protein